MDKTVKTISQDEWQRMMEDPYDSPIDFLLYDGVREIPDGKFKGVYRIEEGLCT